MHLLLKSGIQEMANPSSKLQVTQQFSNAFSEYQHHKIHNSTGNCYPKCSAIVVPHTLIHYPSSSLLLPIQIFRNSVNPTKETRAGKKIPQQEDGALFDRLTRQPGGLQRRGRERWSRRNGTRPIMTQPLCYYFRLRAFLLRSKLYVLQQQWWMKKACNQAQKQCEIWNPKFQKASIQCHNTFSYVLLQMYGSSASSSLSSQ
jgi:hypothetical protein